MMSGGRNRFPFTPSQWQELEHQALIFKYMVSGIPVPPDLLFTIKRSCMDSSKFFPRQPPHMGWSCFPMGLERKIDPEPGRCRRTDGKKWRCSKEAYPDSKYCERHMHRGKNRSRKPVEVPNQTNINNNTLMNPLLSSSSSSTPSTISYISKNPCSSSSPLLSSPSPSLSLLSPDQNYLHHYSSGSYHGLSNEFLSSHASRSPVISLSTKDNSSHHLLLDSAVSCSLSSSDYRNRDVYGMEEEVGEHAFFSEPSGSMRNLSGSSMDEAWQLSPLTMSSSSSSTTKQRSSSFLHHEYSYLQLQTLNDHNTSPKQQKQFQHSYASSIKEDEPQKTVHRFFDEWPPKNKDSWLDLDDKSSNTASVSTTMLSISIPLSSHEFPIFNSRTHNDG